MSFDLIATLKAALTPVGQPSNVIEKFQDDDGETTTLSGLDLKHNDIVILKPLASAPANKHTVDLSSLNGDTKLIGWFSDQDIDVHLSGEANPVSAQDSQGGIILGKPNTLVFINQGSADATVKVIVALEAA